MKVNTIPTYFDRNEVTTIRKVIDEHYDLGKRVSYAIWNNPKDYQGFEDLYHTSLYNIIHCLDGKKMEKNAIANYFFRSFRVNVIRMYQYAYHRLSDDIDIEGMLVPVYNEQKIQDHLDGWGMIELVRNTFGENKADALLSQLNGFTVKTTCERHNVTYYDLVKIKKFLMNYYKSDGYTFQNGIWVKDTSLIL